MTRINEISKAFSQHAFEYELVAKAQHEIGMRLLSRLYYLKIKPQRILDLGSGPGFFSRELALMYPKAQVISLDLAPAMLKETKKKHTWRRKWPLIAANMECMPFVSGAFDLIFSNQVIHWGSSLNQVFYELNRVMKPNGCLMFTTLGPDTFIELKQAWAGINSHAHVNEFVDMHDIGDSMVSERFLDPVIDRELLVLHYSSLPKLLKSLKAQGVKNLNPNRNTGLTSKSSWVQFEKNYHELMTAQGKFPLTYEVVYGHAWKGMQRKIEHGIETAIPLSQILKRGQS